MWIRECLYPINANSWGTKTNVEQKRSVWRHVKQDSCISYDLKRRLHFLNISLRYDIASHGKRRDVHKLLRHHIKIFPCETVLEDGIKCTALQLL